MSSLHSTDIQSTDLPVIQGTPISEQVSLQAVEWLVALQAPDATRTTHEACQQWRNAHPDHERAWQHIESFGAELRKHHSPLLHGALVREDSDKRVRRRQAVKLFMVVAFTGSGAWYVQGRHERADHSTTTGEHRTVTLVDGTQIILNTASAIDVRFDETQRLVKLLRGEILVTTAPDAVNPLATPRPFYVETQQGRLRALGTRFLVHQRTDDSKIAVFEGAVEIRPADAPDTPCIIRAGGQTSFSRTAIGEPQPADMQSSTWTTGVLVARDMHLTDFVAELARYRPGRLTCDPAIGHLRISGIYPLDDTDRVLDMLRRTQPVDIHSLTRYWVSVRPRSE